MAKVIAFPRPAAPLSTRDAHFAHEFARLLADAPAPRRDETLKLLREINGKLDRLLP